MKIVYPIIILIVFFISSCSTQYQCRVGLENVSISDVIVQNAILVDAQSDIYRFEDSTINIAWQVREKDISFKLFNKASQTIKIIWDDAVYVGTDGTSKRIIHKGVKFAKIEEHQVPSPVAPGSFIDDIIVPAENIDYVSSGWAICPLFPINSNYENDKAFYAKQYIGKPIKIILPIQWKNKHIEYTFNFRIREFSFK